MYNAAHTDFFKSETSGDIKIIITHHLYIYKSCVFTQNLEGVTQKISLPCPWEVWNGQGRGSVIFQATLFKFCGKLTSFKIFLLLVLGTNPASLSEILIESERFFKPKWFLCNLVFKLLLILYGFILWQFKGLFIFITEKNLKL